MHEGSDGTSQHPATLSTSAPSDLPISGSRWTAPRPTEGSPQQVWELALDDQGTQNSRVRMNVLNLTA